MTFYEEIDALQPPMDAFLDPAGRQCVSFNILCEKEKSDTFLQEITKLLVTAGTCVEGTTLFIGSMASLPTDEDATFLFLRATGGMKSRRKQNVIGPGYERPTAQLVAFSNDEAAALALAQAAYNVLTAVRNQDVTP